MNEAGPYVKVYRRIVDDPRYADIYHDLRLLGAWLRLHILADAGWPASAEVPSWCSSEDIDRLAATEVLVRYPHGRFRMPEYDVEREGRAEAARKAGRASGEKGHWRKNPEFVRNIGSGASAPERPSRSMRQEPRNSKQLNAATQPNRSAPAAGSNRRGSSLPSAEQVAVRPLHEALPWTNGKLQYRKEHLGQPGEADGDE